MRDDTALRVFVYDRLFATGRPPSIADLAARFGGTSDGMREWIGSLGVGKALLLHPQTGELWMLGPFAARPTSFEIRGRTATWWANCAWDLFGVAALVKEPVTISATCPDCGHRMTSSGVLDDFRRIDALCHFLLPAREWYRDIGFT